MIEHFFVLSVHACFYANEEVPAFPKRVNATYSTYVVLDCDCENGITKDYYECVAIEPDVGFLFSVILIN